MITTPALTKAARAIWDRGRTTGKTFDELSDNQRADLIADAAAAIATVPGISREIAAEIRLVLRAERADSSTAMFNCGTGAGDGGQGRA